ncbi:MAG: hypothetical protein HRU06_00885 [Oceanospirillaceae bacterium]|nr:hypothetical protein [Oceanospirillaceae bacterium]
MSDLHHPDIEIYIKNCSPEQVTGWLSSQAIKVSISKKSELTLELDVDFAGGSTQAVLQQKVSGKAWSSLWLKTNTTPWPTDLDCAAHAANFLETQIRCIKGGWSEDEDDTQDDDQWWKIEGNERELIKWQG